jgi:hypothetical protein
MQRPFVDLTWNEPLTLKRELANIVHSHWEMQANHILSWLVVEGNVIIREVSMKE